VEKRRGDASVLCLLSIHAGSKGRIGPTANRKCGGIVISQVNEKGGDLQTPYEKKPCIKTGANTRLEPDPAQYTATGESHTNDMHACGEPPPVNATAESARVGLDGCATAEQRG